MILESLLPILGAGLGSLARLAPEIMKLWDRKNERLHELAMLDRNFEFEKLRGQQVLATEEVKLDMAELRAISESYKAQSPTGNSWIDGYNSSVRATVTYVFLLLYAFTKWAIYNLSVQDTGSVAQAILRVWGSDDMAIFGSIIGYWFVDRTLRKMGRV